MRKYLIGIFIGAALTISTSAFADDVISLIGQKIQGEFPVKINGTELEKPAIVINGTSYLPNRAIADALGMDIKFDADLGIELSTKEVSNKMTEQTAPEVTYDLGYINGMIELITTRISNYKTNIEEQPSNEQMEVWKKGLKEYEEQLAIWEARKAAITQ